MNRLIAYAVVIMVLLFLVGQDISGVMHLFGLLFLLFSAFHLIFRRRLPGRFWENMGLLFIGPFIILCLIYALLNSRALNDLGVIFLIILGIACIWYILKWRQHRSPKQPSGSQIRSHERDFVQPHEYYSNKFEIPDEGHDQ